MTQRHTIAIVLLAIAAVVAIPLIATHQAHACFGRRDLDCNPTTGNPHPTAGFGDQNPGTTETGNPHNSQSHR